MGKLLWEVGFGHAVSSPGHKLLQPPHDQSPRSLISGGRITMYPLACGTGKIPNLTVLGLRGWLLMAEGLHVWRCHLPPMGRATDVLRAHWLGVSKFSEWKSWGFHCQSTLDFGQMPQGACFEKGNVCAVCRLDPAQGYTEWRQPWPATHLPQARGTWSPWLLEKWLGTLHKHFSVKEIVWFPADWLWIINFFFFYPEESDGSTLREILIVNY